MSDPVPVFQTLTKAQAAVIKLADLPMLSATERAMLREASLMIGATTGHFVDRVGIVDQFGRVTVAPPPATAVVVELRRP